MTLVFGKEEVTSSILVNSSKRQMPSKRVASVVLFMCSELVTSKPSFSHKARFVR